MNDGSSKQLSSVVWSSSDSKVLTLSNDPTNAGLAFAVSPGIAIVSACIGTICGTTAAGQTPPFYISIAPANPVQLQGTIQQFTATANYTSGSVVDITGSAAWQSSNAAVATIASGGTAMTATTATGSTTITASLAGAVGSTILSVTNFSSSQLPAVGPGTRCCMGMVFVPVDASGNTNYTLVFGGYRTVGVDLGDTWSYKSGTWTQLGPPASPPAREGMGMVYDAAHKVVVLFGGQNAALQDLNDTWTWDGTTWTNVTPATSPVARRSHTSGMAYDAAHSNVVLFGGVNSNGTVFFDDTWTWNGSAWTQQSPANHPIARRAPLACDPATGNVVLFGGEGSYAGPTLGDTWIWDGTNWTQQFPASFPPVRSMGSMAYDASAGNSTSGKLVLFGGSGSGSTPPYVNDVWTWDGATWSQVYPYNPPPVRYAAGLAFDPASGLLVYGGLQNHDGIVLGDFWVLAP